LKESAHGLQSCALAVALVIAGCGRPSVSGGYIGEDSTFGKVRLVFSQAGDGITGTWQAHPSSNNVLSDGLETNGTLAGKMVVHRHWYGAMRRAELTLLLESKAAGPYAGCVIAITKAGVAGDGASIDAPYSTMTPQCPTGGGLMAIGRWHLVRDQ